MEIKNNYFSSTSEATFSIQEVPNSILSKIFSHLPSDTLHNAKLVCKTWNQIISFHHPFNCIYRNVENFFDADFYLVGRDLDLSERQRLLGKLISLLAAKHRVFVLLEGAQAMQKKSDVEGFMNDFSIPLSLKENISFVGWDIEGMGERLAANQKKHIELWGAQKSCHLWEEQMTILLANFPGSIHDWNNEQLLLYLQFQNGLLEAKSLFISIASEILELENRFVQDLPQRIVSMSETLEAFHVQSGIEDFSGKIVLCADKRILQKQQEETATSKLAPLYHTLQHLKAVVLLPKFI